MNMVIFWSPVWFIFILRDGKHKTTGTGNKKYPKCPREATCAESERPLPRICGTLTICKHFQPTTPAIWRFPPSLNWPGALHVLHVLQGSDFDSSNLYTACWSDGIATLLIPAVLNVSSINHSICPTNGT